jgi:hypothetical protein
VPEAAQSRITITADEDMEAGYMLADEAAPKDPFERLAVLCFLSATEWGTIFDPREIRQVELRGFVDDGADFARPAKEGEEPTAGLWYVFMDLDVAQVDA